MSQSSVLLISPSSNTYYTLTAPLGLSYIATQLVDQFDVYGLDLNVYHQNYNVDVNRLLDLVERIVSAYSIKYVGVSILEETIEEAIAIAEICKKKGIYCFAGGIYPTLFPERVSKYFNYCIRGDGEFAVRELLLSLEAGRKPENIQGLSIYSEASKQCIHNGEIVPINCKNDFLPRRDVFARLNGSYKYSSARVITSRGCVYHCTFCTNSVFQSRYIRRKIDGIIEEVNRLAIEGIKEIILSDDQFLGTNLEDYKQALDILKAIKDILIDNSMRINFQVRAEQWLKCIDYLPDFLEEIISISKGFKDNNEEVHKYINGRIMHGVGIDIGIESFLDLKLLKLGKKCTSDTNIKCIRSIIDLPIDVGIYFILFTPDISMEEVIAEIETYYNEYLVKGYKSKVLLSNIFKSIIPYEGTIYHQELLKRGEIVEPRGYRFRDARVAAFYIIVNEEIPNMVYRDDISFDMLYSAVLGFACYCKELRIEGEMEDILSCVIANQENDIAKIYSVLSLG